MYRPPGFRPLTCLAPIVLALCACTPDDEAGSGRGQAAVSHGGASTAASAPVAGSLAERLDHFERVGRAKPRLYEEQLRALGAGLPPDRADLLDILALRALLAAYGRDKPLSDRLVQELRDWTVPAQREAALVAATIAAAEYLRSHGDRREARKLLIALDPAQLAAAGLVHRWRYRMQLANIGSDSNALDVALTEGQEARRLAEQTGQPWRVAKSLLELAYTALRADSPVRARQLAAQALVEARKDPDPMTLNQVHTMRAIVHMDDSDTRIVPQALAEAMAQAAAAGADAVEALGMANLAEYYLQQGEPARALALAEQALPAARRALNANIESAVRFNIGLAKIALGRIAEGREDSRAGLLLDEQLGAIAYATDGWKQLGAILEEAGDLAGAVAAYRAHRALAERVSRDETRQLLLEAQERQDAEQRARDIELLNRDNALKAEQVHQRNLALTLWAALGGGAAVSVALLWQAFRRARRANEALALSNALLQRQGETDPLTGLANRRHCQAAVASASADSGLVGGVFLIDVDHFKCINDAFGHAAGDAVLVELARRMRLAVRDDDLVVRWGGEEFLIVVRPRDGLSAPVLAQRLLDLTGGEPVMHEGRRIGVTASIGFVNLPVPPHGLMLSWERAIDLVDMALYLAKGGGRNRACGVERIHAVDANAAVALTARLEAAWREGQVALTVLDGPQQQDGRRPVGA